ncbi:PAS and ANTAR domain-containing protein [Cellulosimicrobium sp. SH8]|uniref:PAS and ANTAR domain-containing protein n=1 Tax=Cellulosimicrobium sp. SH8 TaxID=2952936 RepID=UPI0021F32B90|nr:PAS and ANTAR domain-containing protein [Cellulosimicrobium sp. SH8]
MSVDDHAIEQALARGAHQQIGQYRLDLSTGVWWWSPETYRLHGFEPGDVVPTTPLVLAHKHPDDRERVRQILDEARRTGEPFSSVHRIMDAHGGERFLVVVGQGRRDRETGTVTELVGYFVDVTRTVTTHAQERARHDIAAAAETRGTIEQAKGAVMLAYGVDPDEAFARLRRASNDRNVPLRELARLVVHESTTGGPDGVERVTALLR